MRIVYFDLVTHFGGAAQCMVLTWRELKSTEEVHVVDAYGSCKMYSDALDEAGIPLHVLLPEAKRVFIGHKDRPLARLLSLCKQLGSLLKLRRRLIRKILEIDPDLLCTTSRKAMPFLALSWRLRQYPIVFYAHGWFKREQVVFYKRWLIRNRTRCVLAVSQATSEALQSWGVSEEKIAVVFNAISFDDVLSTAKKGLRPPPPGADRHPLIVVPGTLLPTKGQHTAVRAAHILKDKGLEVVMWLAGDAGVVGTTPYLDHLEQLITEYGLEENVLLLGWRDDVPALMKEADLVVFPTHSEGLGLVVIEAMLLRRPVISTPVGGVTELIVDGKTGLLIEVDDAEGLALAIERLVSDRDLCQAITENAYRQLSEKFSLERHAVLVRSALVRAQGNAGRRQAAKGDRH